ncbi:DNA-binding protein [Bacillus methanolicus]|jgi:excisionase family DNA binding protein|uniref:helix-turn-helix domain-containing protein n=1 Tax=Bacillus methanolicus TaxID=1471 RepID=UPI00237FFDE9|nr:helix-turn-helix domain-containing protein [Bacillus methanolicus]MDE3838004.1 DNA-binding protein [Bacillus methanolicus]
MELLTVYETAKLLKLSTNRVYALIKQGVLPSVRVGGSIRVVREDLEQFLKGDRKYDTE